jgi:Cellulase (glycosyl hydrolase family 5)/Peptidase family M23
MAASNFKWPVQVDQARISSPYNAGTGSIGFFAPKGTPVRAVVKGKVYAADENSAQIASEQFAVLYANLQNVKVKAGQSVNAEDVIGEAGAGESITLTIYQIFDATALFEKPAAPVTTPPPATTPSQKIYVKALSEGVRLREKAVDGKPVGQLKLDEVIESAESEAATREKVGVEGQWLQVRRADGTTPFVAAWFVAITSAPVPVVFPPTTGSLIGMNLDINHPIGRPAADQLKGIGWVRIKFNVSLDPSKAEGDPKRYGNKDINAAFNRYKPFIEQYTRSGIKVLMVFTHQLYGEGAGFDWRNMEGRWTQLVPTYADFAKQVAQRFLNTGLVHAYQIWNEQDTDPKNARAAVCVPAKDYGYMLTETIRAIRSVDKTTPIITGGHTTGPGSGSAYARATLAVMPSDVRPDAIAVHPYGRGVKGHRFSNWGALDDEIKAYAPLLPGKPIWFTEWGVLDHQGRTDVIPAVADYVGGFMDIIKNRYPGQVAAAIWYAWADSMDNGFGLVDTNGKPKPGLFEKFKSVG